MRKRSKLLLAGLTAALILAAAVGSASANNLSLSAQNQRITWSALNFIAGTSTVTCAVTLEGSFHNATSRKVVGTLLGYITRAVVGTCARGSATVLTASLPWHIQYAGFTGTLPNITAVLMNMIGASFAVKPEGSLTCLAQTEASHPSRGSANVEGGVITELNALVEAEIPLRGEGGLCAFGGAGHFSGSGRVAVLGTTTAVSIRLI